MTNDTMTVKIWNGSPIIGKTIKDIRSDYNIDIKKVTRGKLARNPWDTERIEESDYITFEDDQENIKKFVNVVNSIDSK